MDIFKSNIVVGLTAGLAATVLAPVVIPVVAMAARPLAKSLLKGGVLLYEKGREALASAGEEMEDLIAEVRSEMEMEHGGHGYGYAAPDEAGDLPQAGTQEDVGPRPEAGPAARHSGNGAHAS
ncbi:DUF5132 domain-containing protein [Noviherbaspirillum sp. UKPF54]|uniref:DUF5132 domain-containing protein n=1 Tax=Noviherbaspirillum sp. UKPF54 TaxID=2601898 RepID=UPI0011B17810|nr:DUF5132 domain-containing protein [Noviherbaspirillum sp. UKPF54]QDZ28364.1 DUF5132 domain-containing protein [Noviherbaspirillum sp. UKPF54]